MSRAEQLSKTNGMKLNGSNSLCIGYCDSLSSVGLSKLPFAMNQADYRKSKRTEAKNKNYSRHGVPQEFFDKLPEVLNEATMFVDNNIKMTVITDFEMNDTKGQKSLVIAGILKNSEMAGGENGESIL